MCVCVSVYTLARTHCACARMFAHALVYECVTVFKVTRKSIEEESRPVELRKDSLISLSAPNLTAMRGTKSGSILGCTLTS